MNMEKLNRNEDFYPFFLYFSIFIYYDILYIIFDFIYIFYFHS